LAKKRTSTWSSGSCRILSPHYPAGMIDCSHNWVWATCPHVQLWQVASPRGIRAKALGVVTPRGAK
jgi:hypothetical protein